MKPSSNKMPKHVGIILDGNRRFAKRLMMNPWKGHEFGAKKVRKLLKWCKEFKIEELTLFAFSLDNFHRPEKEFNYLMDLFEKEFESIKEDKEIYKEKIKINFVGRIELFPEKVKKHMKELMEKTKHHDKFTVNFAMAYGGRAEIVDAAKKIVEDVTNNKLNSNEITEETFRKYLYAPNNADMIIRTGGEKRTSGFLLWQGEYSELFFTDKLWPEFEKEDFIACINEYQDRDRRFGR